MSAKDNEESEDLIDELPGEDEEITDEFDYKSMIIDLCKKASDKNHLDNKARNKLLDEYNDAGEEDMNSAKFKFLFETLTEYDILSIGNVSNDESEDILTPIEDSIKIKDSAYVTLHIKDSKPKITNKRVVIKKAYQGKYLCDCYTKSNKDYVLENQDLILSKAIILNVINKDPHGVVFKNTQIKDSFLKDYKLI
jgi:hypothetical protein